jgi:Cu+-exporting ATPase
MSTAAVNKPDFGHADLPIEGMTCGACATRLEKALRRVPGVQDANVNFALERAAVDFAAEQTDLPALADAVTRAGFQVGHEQYSSRSRA